MDTSTAGTDSAHRLPLDMEASQSEPSSKVHRRTTRLFRSLLGPSPSDFAAFSVSEPNPGSSNHPTLDSQIYDLTEADAEDLAHCNRLLAHALTQPRIQKLFNALTKNSCPLTPSRHIRCVRCTPQVAGGFGPAIGIALCADRRIPPRRFNDALAHELIHAYDYCTRNIDFEDPKQHACAEIRAASLSGDCEWDREWARKRYLAIPFRKGAFESCVRRRAALAVMYNREVGDVGKAFQVVKEMYDICVQDVQPFTKDDLIQLD